MLKLDEMWSNLEEARAQLEGQAGPSALVGGLLGLVLEGWRFISLTAERLDGKRQELATRVEQVRTRLESRAVNVHRTASAVPALTNVNTTITNNGGSVTIEADSAASDQAARIRITNGSVSEVSSVIARVDFARDFTEAPVVKLAQDSGTEIGLAVANVTKDGFDLTTGAGIAPATVVTVVYVALSTQPAESIA